MSYEDYADDSVKLFFWFFGAGKLLSSAGTDYKNPTADGTDGVDTRRP
jgi:hypothetical protein